MNDWYHYDNEIEDKDWQDRAAEDLRDELFIRRDEKRPQFDPSGTNGMGSDNAGGGGVPDGDIFDRVHGQLAEVDMTKQDKEATAYHKYRQAETALTAARQDGSSEEEIQRLRERLEHLRQQWVMAREEVPA